MCGHCMINVFIGHFGERKILGIAKGRCQIAEEEITAIRRGMYKTILKRQLQRESGARLQRRGYPDDE